VLLAHAFMDAGRQSGVTSEKVVRGLQAGGRAVPLPLCIEAPMQGMTHDLDAMLAAITPKTKAGGGGQSKQPDRARWWTKSRSRPVRGGRCRTNVVTVFDEAYMELLDPKAIQVDTVKHAKAGKKPVITLRTFSKAYGLAGLRVGYAMAQPDAIDLLNKVRQPFNVTAMAQAAAVAALEDEALSDRDAQDAASEGRAAADGLACASWGSTRWSRSRTSSCFPFAEGGGADGGADEAQSDCPPHGRLRPAAARARERRPGRRKRPVPGGAGRRAGGTVNLIRQGLFLIQGLTLNPTQRLHEKRRTMVPMRGRAYE
jgi:hypothetical protein